MDDPRAGDVRGLRGGGAQLSTKETMTAPSFDRSELAKALGHVLSELAEYDYVMGDVGIPIRPWKVLDGSFHRMRCVDGCRSRGFWPPAAPISYVLCPNEG